MGRPAKSKADTVYPPRGMRCDRAAAYLDMSPASFLRLVKEGDLPPGINIRGMVMWDRYELDTAFENFKDRRQRKRNTVHEALGIEDDDGALWMPVDGPAERRNKEREQAQYAKQDQRERDEKARELKRQIKEHRQSRRAAVTKDGHRP